jgi:hypothetical protein
MAGLMCSICVGHELSWKLAKVTKFHNFASKLTKLRKLKRSNEVTNSKVGTTRFVALPQSTHIRPGFEAYGGASEMRRVSRRGRR